MTLPLGVPKNCQRELRCFYGFQRLLKLVFTHANFHVCGSSENCDQRGSEGEKCRVTNLMKQLSGKACILGGNISL